ncbi:benzyl alcohol O-benzoyltransferase [Beta vulgaris subsp. vulgaris]|uniref:benzyl alcohol O-benzoyltransferase n=1 Tax=Beta vulgaris subsp. vulgaris TaxID=3555 RepID=UPI0020368262|nr:benzyl alcohol O-benzoyltransferase [Beta vulgaris subsp. vulgaris]
MALMAQDTTPLVLNVTRAMPELVCPAEPTPRELKPLSDIDDQEGLRFHMPAVMFYKADPSMEGRDPVEVVKEGLARALVLFYPYAGRLVEGQARKLSVDCTGEGVVFVEADADARLEDFGDEIHPPFPLEDLLYDMPGTDAMLGTPLLIFQVTRLRCGGFVVALRVNHAIGDGSGVMQFMNAVGEMSKGFVAPSILPVWDRERLTSKRSPNVSFAHHEYDQHEDEHHSDGETNLIQQSFLFGPTELAALRRHVSPGIKQYSTFDILSASLWRCRTIALGLDPEEEVRLLFAVNARSKFNPPLAKGYYGNACAFPAICAKAGDICQNKVEYILELIRKTKSEINEEYMRSIMDLMVTNDRPHFTVRQTYVVSDLRHLGFADVDFGWGKPVFGGPGSNGSVPDASFFISFKNKKGETMTMVPISLPPPVMNVFVNELQEMLQLQL